MTGDDQRSIAQRIAMQVVATVGRENARGAIQLMCAKYTTVELAALADYWDFWARPKQMPPKGKWRSWGFLTGRAFGKTVSVSRFVRREAQQGRAMRIGLIAQKEDTAVNVMIEGNSGLLRTSPKWFKPLWEPSKLRLTWPNGAEAMVYTPEAPGAIRGDEQHLFWATEIQSWPNATRMEAYSNLLLSTRLGYARFVWDATPKKRHPILKERIAMAEAEPTKHYIVRGSTYENAANLGDGVVDDLRRKLEGTQQGKEELLGEMLDDDEEATVRQHHIDAARRPRPARFVRKVIGVDAAVTERAGSDETGIVMGGLGTDGQCYILANRTGKYDPAKWAGIVLDMYAAEGASLIVVETNKGGDLVTRNIRATAKERKLQVIVIDKDDDAPPRRDAVVFVREVYSRGQKEDRAQPMSIAYQHGRVSHVADADLNTLENTITTWIPEPGARSPDDLDALVFVVTELLGLAKDNSDPRAAFDGVLEVARALRTPSANVDIASMLRSSSGRGI